MKHTMKLVAILVAIIAISALCLTACGEKADFTVGILQPITHDALGAANKGFQDELTRLMTEAGKTVEFRDENALGSEETMMTIVGAFMSEDVDLMLTIGTGATQVAAGLEKTTPILFTAVTDPAGAGLVSSNKADREANNISGTSDMNPVALQMQLCKDLGMTKVAFLYTSSEDNSRIQIEMAIEACKSIGLQYVVKTIASADEILSVMNEIGADDSIDGIYCPTDNTLASNVATLHAQNLANARLPIVCGEESMNNLCGVATYSINYEELGKQTARMAFDILMGNKKVGEMPVEYQSGTPALSLNEAVAEQLGFDLSVLED
ncbi:MAG: ABC transporter substrate-binding protein [Clostridia bacterium]|nr:ABC transporter substrate-binding protein [Clostridia bacterium]